MKPTLDLSIVTSLYCSSPYVDEFCRRASAAATKVTPSYEIILVNDGSPDDSLDIATTLQRQDPHVVVVDLSRNFGHHAALLTGLSYAAGRRIFLIDCDLEEDPEWVSNFLEVLLARRADAVYGVQANRKGNLFERASGWLFYKIFNSLSAIPVPESAVTARLMSHRYVQALLEYREREIFLPGLWPLAGFLQVPHIVQKKSKGSTTYSLARRLRLMVNAVTSFSNKPLVFIFYTGLAISGIAVLYMIWLLHLRLFRGVPIMGWTSTIVSVWFLGGLTIFFIGVIGIYLAKVFSEIKQRPRSIVRQVFSSRDIHAPKEP